MLLGITLVMSSTIGFTRTPLSISLQGNYLKPSDSKYKEIYGNSKFFPGIKVDSGSLFMKSLSLWGSAGYLSASGTIPGTDQSAKSTQLFICGGGALHFKVSPMFRTAFRAGIAYISYKEEALETTVNESAIGFCGALDLIVDVNDFIFVELEGAYISASDTLPGAAANDTVEIKLGGLKAGFGIGIKL